MLALLAGLLLPTAASAETPATAASAETASVDTAGATASALAADTILTAREGADLIQQALATMHNDARQRPTRWYAAAEQPAVRPIPVWSDLSAGGRAWSEKQMQGVCPDGRLICHNVSPVGVGYTNETCCWRLIAENVSYRATWGTPFTPAAAESFAKSMTDGLMASDGHRRNIMQSRWDDFGVGVHVRTEGDRTTVIATFIFRELVSTPPGSRVDQWGSTFTPGMTLANVGGPPPAPKPTITLAPLTAACPISTTPATVFGDVATTHQHQRAIDCAAHLQVAAGYADGTFRPEVRLTRAHAASFLARLLDTLGVELPEPSSSFADVPASHTHHVNIGVLAELGIANGFADGRFGPSEPVTRAQYAAMVNRALTLVDAGYAEAPRADYFADDDGSTHEAGMNRLAERGILAGPRAGVIEARARLTRAEAAAIGARSVDVAVRDGFGSR